jgi:hypothetical protein
LTYPAVQGEGYAVAVSPRRTSRDAGLAELQRLHAAILASKARRGALPAPPAVAAAGAPSAERLAALELTRRLQAEGVDDGGDIPAEAATSKKVRWLLVAAVVLAAGAWVAMTVLRQPASVADASPAATPTPRPPAAAAAGDAAPVVAAPPVAPVVSARAVRVALTTVRPVWMRVMVDGTRAIEREVEAGQTLTFEGDRSVVVRSGDAGAIQATLNGVDRGALGLRGWPLTVSMTADALEPLTPTRPER